VRYASLFAHTLSHVAEISRDPRFPAKRPGNKAKAFSFRENDSVATPRLLPPITAIALSACSMQQTPAIPTAPAPNAPAIAQRSPAPPQRGAAPSPSASAEVDAPTTGDSCDADGGIRPTPCEIDFTPANSGAAAVTLATPSGAKGSLVAQDDCSKSGIAAISQQAADQWLVTAGSKHGTCTVHFTYSRNGSDAGQAVLRIANAT
jgi:hypothetical protein